MRERGAQFGDQFDATLFGQPEIGLVAHRLKNANAEISGVNGVFLLFRAPTLPCGVLMSTIRERAT